MRSPFREFPLQGSTALGAGHQPDSWLLIADPRVGIERQSSRQQNICPEREDLTSIFGQTLVATQGGLTIAAGYG